MPEKIRTVTVGMRFAQRAATLEVKQSSRGRRSNRWDLLKSTPDKKGGWETRIISMDASKVLRLANKHQKALERATGHSKSESKSPIRRAIGYLRAPTGSFAG